jgi:hypothetical protein
LLASLDETGESQNIAYEAIEDKLIVIYFSKPIHAQHGTAWVSSPALCNLNAD